jgi:uncharacterized protein (DUF2062 family)
VVRINGSARSIALGLAAGAFVSASPFLGLHLVFASLIAWAIGGNIIASVIGTWTGNPLTFPFIWLGTFKLGHLFLGTQGNVNELNNLGATTLFNSPLELLWPVIVPMALGGIPIGIVMAIIVYYFSYVSVKFYQKRRVAMMAKFVAMRASKSIIPEDSLLNKRSKTDKENKR